MTAHQRAVRRGNPGGGAYSDLGIRALDADDSDTPDHYDVTRGPGRPLNDAEYAEDAP